MNHFGQIQIEGGPDVLKWNMTKLKSDQILPLETVSGHVEKENQKYDLGCYIQSDRLFQLKMMILATGNALMLKIVKIQICR